MAMPAPAKSAWRLPAVGIVSPKPTYLRDCAAESAAVAASNFCVSIVMVGLAANRKRSTFRPSAEQLAFGGACSMKLTNAAGRTGLAALVTENAFRSRIPGGNISFYIEQRQRIILR